MLPPSPSHLRRSRLAILWALVLLAASSFSACSKASSNTLAVENANDERLNKTVFTEKLGAYLVYPPLKADQPSYFALRLTDLDDGTPVAKAEVMLNVRSKINQAATTFKSAGERDDRRLHVTGRAAESGRVLRRVSNQSFEIQRAVDDDRLRGRVTRWMNLVRHRPARRFHMPYATFHISYRMWHMAYAPSSYSAFYQFTAQRLCEESNWSLHFLPLEIKTRNYSY